MTTKQYTGLLAIICVLASPFAANQWLNFANAQHEYHQQVEAERQQAASQRQSVEHNLARLRLSRGVSQRVLAEKIGYSPSTIQAVELGRLELSGCLAACVAAYFKVGQEGREWLLDNDLTTPVPETYPVVDLEINNWI